MFRLDMDRCHRHPCHNGGTCLSEGDDIKCQCSQGYRGVFCEGKLSNQLNVY